MKYVYYCPVCGYLGSTEGDCLSMNCPECGHGLLPTHMERERWAGLTKEEKERQKELWRSSSKPADQVIVTTGDLKQDYEILGPVYYQISNKGLFGSALSQKKKEYADQIQARKNSGAMSAERADWGFLYGEWSVGQNDFEAAFYIATEELKKRARMLGGDAVICMRQDIDLDTNAFSYFYLQMYGTAVRFR